MSMCVPGCFLVHWQNFWTWVGGGGDDLVKCIYVYCINFIYKELVQPFWGGGTGFIRYTIWRWYTVHHHTTHTAVGFPAVSRKKIYLKIMFNISLTELKFWKKKGQNCYKRSRFRWGTGFDNKQLWYDMIWFDTIWVKNPNPNTMVYSSATLIISIVLIT